MHRRIEYAHEPPTCRSSLSVTTARADDEVVVRPAGDLDLTTFRILRDAGTALLAEGVRTIAVDCSQLRFVDSTGLATLVELIQLTERLGGRMVLRSPAPILLTLLDASGLRDCLPVEADPPPATVGRQS